MSADWTLLVDPSDAVLEGARSVLEPRLDVVGVDAEEDALYALSKWSEPRVVLVRLSLATSEDGLALARKLRSQVGDKVLVVVYGRPPPGAAWDLDKLLRRFELDLLLLQDLDGVSLAHRALAELDSGAAMRARAQRVLEDLERIQRGEETQDDPSSALLGMRKQIQREAATESPGRAQTSRRGRESTWEEILEARLTLANLKVLWAKGNGRPAFLPE
jgi:hypothetical protein